MTEGKVSTMLPRQLRAAHASQCIASRNPVYVATRPHVKAAASSTAPPAAAEVPAQQQAGSSSGQDRKKVSFVSLGCPKNVVDGELTQRAKASAETGHLSEPLQPHPESPARPAHTTIAASAEQL